MASALPAREGFVPLRGYRTWYRVVGALDRPAAGPAPLLTLHAGPGAPHDGLEPLAGLARAGRPVVFYDQLGCGRSDRPDDPDLWAIPTFLEELGAVREALGLARIHLLGHSWGGRLALAYALTRPAGLLSLVLASTTACNLTRQADLERVRETLPPEVRDALRRHEATGTTDDPAYQAAQRVFASRHACRLDPWPDFLQRALAGTNPAIGRAMAQRPDLYSPGGLMTWDVRERLGEIRVPTLVTAGRHDGLVPGHERALAAGIPWSELVVFEESAHYAHAEEPERYLAVLEEFLARVERRAAAGR